MSVKASDIYKEIVQRNGIASVAEDSYIRNLRNKMTFLMEQVVLRKVSDFKKGKNILIPNNDAAIVRNLLMCSIDDEYPWIVGWFNGSVDLSDSFNCIWIFNSIKEPIMRAEITGETDAVTVDEWIAAIKGVLNVDMAQNTIEMKRKLEEFRVNTLVKGSTINSGDIIVGYEDGSREYAIQGNRQKKRLPDSLLADIVKDLYLQDDYFSVINQIMEYMIQDAEKKAIPDIETYALGKRVSECDTAIEMVEEQNGSMISEYYPWFRKIAAFLHKHPEETKRIEEFAKTSNLEKFFAGN